MSRLIINNPYVSCPSCSGSGLQDSLGGVTECWECGGDTVIRARNAKGQFVTFPEEVEVVDEDEQ